MLSMGLRGDRLASMMISPRWSRGLAAGTPEVSPTASFFLSFLAAFSFCDVGWNQGGWVPFSSPGTKRGEPSASHGHGVVVMLPPSPQWTPPTPPSGHLQPRLPVVWGLCFPPTADVTDSLAAAVDRSNCTATCYVRTCGRVHTALVHGEAALKAGQNGSIPHFCAFGGGCTRGQRCSQRAGSGEPSAPRARGTLTVPTPCRGSHVAAVIGRPGHICARIGGGGIGLLPPLGRARRHLHRIHPLFMAIIGLVRFSPTCGIGFVNVPTTA